MGGWKIKCGVILPQNEMWGAIDECNFYQTMSINVIFNIEHHQNVTHFEKDFELETEAFESGI